MSDRDAHRVRERLLGDLDANPDLGRGPGPPGPRAEIRASWRRVRGAGLAPGAEPDVAPLDDVEIETRRTASALSPLLPLLRDSLEPVVDDGALVVITDADGRVLWRQGRPGVRRLADRLGFVGGSAWTEANVGTNAIGTCLVLDEPVHIAGPEHYVQSHTWWSCAAAPIHDPWSGEVIGAVDISGPARSVQRSMLAMVGVTARLAEAEVRREHTTALERLRSYAAPLMARIEGRALAVDTVGRVAAVTGGPAPGRLVLPSGLSTSSTWLPSLGSVVVEALPGGWLVRSAPTGPEEVDTLTTSLVLDRTGARPEIRITSASHAWTHRPSPRHTEILGLLIGHPEGRSAAQLADDLFGDPTRVVTVRAELSRLRRTLGPLLETRPYRFAGGVAASVVSEG